MKANFFLVVSSSFGGKTLDSGSRVLTCDLPDDVSLDGLNSLLAEGHMRVKVSEDQGSPSTAASIELDKLSVEELKKNLTDRGIQFSEKAKKPELVDLLKKALTPAA